MGPPKLEPDGVQPVIKKPLIHAIMTEKPGRPWIAKQRKRLLGRVGDQCSRPLLSRRLADYAVTPITSLRRALNTLKRCRHNASRTARPSSFVSTGHHGRLRLGPGSPDSSRQTDSDRGQKLACGFQADSIGCSR